MNKNILKEITNVDSLIKKYVNNGYDLVKYFNLTQIHIIGYLLDNIDKEICQKDLEKETGLKKASITGCIDSLVERDIVYRKQCEQDKRKNYIYLTEKALRYQKDFEERVKYLNDRAIENISEEDLKNFYKVLDSIKKNIKEVSR